MQVSSAIHGPAINSLARRAHCRSCSPCWWGWEVTCVFPIPGNPVPVTLQVTFVMLAGAFLTPAMAAASMVIFVGAVFRRARLFGWRGRSGLSARPDRGYVLGFVAGAALCAFIIKGRRDSFPRLVFGMLAGLLTDLRVRRPAAGRLP